MEALAGARKPLSGRARRIDRSREDMLGLLADFSGGVGDYDFDREFSFCRAPNDVEAAPAKKDRRSEETADQRQHEDEAPSLNPQQQEQQAAAPRERRLRRRPSDSRGSCGGGGDGVLLNFYVPGLLTRSMTTPRPCRGTMPPPPALQGAPATVAAGKARTPAPLAIGCWPALWGRGGVDRRNKAAVKHQRA